MFFFDEHDIPDIPDHMCMTLVSYIQEASQDHYGKGVCIIQSPCRSTRYGYIRDMLESNRTYCPNCAREIFKLEQWV